MPVPVRTVYQRRVVPGALSSLIEVRGALQAEGELLVLDYRESWRDPRTFQRTEGPRQRVTVPIAHVDTVEVRRGWFRRAWLVLRSSVFEALREWPGARDHLCELRVETDPHGAFLQAAEELAMSVADAQLRALERRVRGGEGGGEGGAG